MKEELDQQLAAARWVLADHWASCLEFQLEGHSEHAHRAVDQLIYQYFEALKSLPEPGRPDDIMDALKRLFEGLAELNAQSDDALLETDEREVIVPIVIAAAKTAGLPVEDYEDGDPTFAFRMF
ncbi:MAG: hypothetical protein AAF495_03160 [Pseudomonadota bacterium]